MHNYSGDQTNIKKDEIEEGNHAESLIEMSRLDLPISGKSIEPIQAPTLQMRFSEWWDETSRQIDLWFHQRKAARESEIALPQKTFLQKVEEQLARLGKWREWMDRGTRRIDVWFEERRASKKREIALPRKTFLQKGEELLKRFTKWWQWMDRAANRIDVWFEERRAAKRSKITPTQDKVLIIENKQDCKPHIVPAKQIPGKGGIRLLITVGEAQHFPDSEKNSEFTLPESDQSYMHYRGFASQLLFAEKPQQKRPENEAENNKSGHFFEVPSVVM